MVSALNALQINESTGDIVLTCGATGHFQIDITTEGELNPEKDVGVFAIARARSTTYTTVFQKAYPIVKNESGGYSIVISLSNQDTRDLSPATYVWTLILVTEPGTDQSGNVIANDQTDGVYPLWSGDEQPSLELRGAAHVI